jgi:hypothetical protein
MVRTSLSKILTISKNSQTNMLLLIVGQLRYPEVIYYKNAPHISIGAHHNLATLAISKEIAMQFVAIASDIAIYVHGHL